MRSPERPIQARVAWARFPRFSTSHCPPVDFTAYQPSWPLITETDEPTVYVRPAKTRNNLFTSAPTEVVIKARAGEEAARKELIQIYQKRIAGYVFSLTGEPSAVDDLCQVIFIKMLQSLPALREEARFEPWLFRLARNASLDHLRRRRFRNLFTPLLPIHEDLSAPEPSPLAGELAAVKEAIQTLPLRYREILALCAQDRSYEEMAKIAGLTLPNFKIRLHRARQALKERLKYVRNR